MGLSALARGPLRCTETELEWDQMHLPRGPLQGPDCTSDKLDPASGTPTKTAMSRAAPSGRTMPMAGLKPMSPLRLPIAAADGGKSAASSLSADLQGMKAWL